MVNESAFSHYIFSAILYISLKSLLSYIKFETDGRINNVTISLNYCTLLTPNVSLLFKSELVIASNVKVVPEFLRTLVFARPRGDDQFADCTFSPSLDMSR